jgi:hypothetical protein
MFLKALRHWAAAVVGAIAAACAAAQNVPQPSTIASTGQAVMAQLAALRDSFVKQIKAEGFQPSLSPPEIVLSNEPSFGAYDRSTNVLHAAMLEKLQPEQQAGFASLFAPGRKAEQAFDEMVYRWVFSHELGHWWQVCQHKIRNSHYSEESDASRIAAAYWRLKDASFMEMTAKRIAAARESTRTLVAAAQQSEKYFDDNYEKLGPTPAFIWFQCDMVLKVLSEQPLPSFRQTLQ